MPVHYLTCLLSQGGDLPSVEEVEVPAPPLLLQWVKTDQALLMLFSDGTVQVGAHPAFWGKVWDPRVLGRNVDQCSLLCTGELLRGPHEADPQWLGASPGDLCGPKSQCLYLPRFPPPAAGLLPRLAAATALRSAPAQGPKPCLGASLERARCDPDRGPGPERLGALPLWPFLSLWCLTGGSWLNPPRESGTSFTTVGDGLPSLNLTLLSEISLSLSSQLGGIIYGPLLFINRHLFIGM